MTSMGDPLDVVVTGLVGRGSYFVVVVVGTS